MSEKIIIKPKDTPAYREKEKERVKEKEKNEPSQFDRLLAQNKLGLKPDIKLNLDQITQQANYQTKNKDEKVFDREKKKEEAKERDAESDTRSSEKKEGSSGSSQKVLAKGGLKDGSGGSSQGGAGGNAFGGTGAQRKKAANTSESKLASLRTSLQHQAGSFTNRVAKAMNAAASQKPELSQKLLDKLVQYVKVGMNKEGEKEIHLELDGKRFRGLRLKVTSKDGKVAVLLNAQDPKMKKMFEDQQDQILSALEKGGVDVASLHIV